ncbi:hypothetical protein [Conexibacter sp. SYSU D00693]|uniref:hypothetical protein n=1 Tax=Conexibacter sp. SYSU D00693 TaxID=2812560 RepID=UPI00196B3D6E|nr:hypothetical protein [Conexibacter sp. SYSU D00693]
MLSNAFSILTLVVGVVGIAGIMWAFRNGDRDRVHEDDARTFYEEHGHWPDETPEQAAAERARLARVTAPAVAQPDEQGRV